MSSPADAPLVLSAETMVEIGGSLLEGPFWDAAGRRLLLVDIDAQTVVIMDWMDGAVRTVKTDEEVSAVIPRANGGEILACRSGLVALDADEQRPLLSIEADRPWARCNDAACDPAGRLWVGTMADDGRPDSGTLYRVDPALQCTPMIGGLAVANGIVWSPDGDLMYFIDSATRAVSVFDFDATTGDLGTLRRTIDTSNHPGLPDGLTVDAEGCLWVAFYGGSAVRRFTPDGTWVATVKVATPNVTSCAFAGPDLDHLVITTARSSEGSGGGDVYVARPEVRGLPCVSFAG